MKRNQAIDKVVSELKVIKEELMGGKTINPLRFLTFLLHCHSNSPKKSLCY